MNNFILCGFMGCGKTTVGRLLAKRLCYDFLDLDAEIERESGENLPALFCRYGEPHFRELESAALARLSRCTNTVIATGGGALANPSNAALLSPQDRIVFLDAPYEVCFTRIRNSTRPLVRSSTPAQLRALFDTRRAAYLAVADVVVDAAVAPSKTVAAFLATLK